MADSGWGCKSNGANPRWGCKSNFDGAVSPMGRCVHTNWGAQYRGAVSPASQALRQGQCFFVDRIRLTFSSERQFITRRSFCTIHTFMCDVYKL